MDGPARLWSSDCFVKRRRSTVHSCVTVAARQGCSPFARAAVPRHIHRLPRARPAADRSGGSGSPVGAIGRRRLSVRGGAPALDPTGPRARCGAGRRPGSGSSCLSSVCNPSPAGRGLAPAPDAGSACRCLVADLARLAVTVCRVGPYRRLLWYNPSIVCAPVALRRGGGGFAQERAPDGRFLVVAVLA